MCCCDVEDVLSVVETSNSGLGARLAGGLVLLLVAEANESESTAATGVTVLDDNLHAMCQQKAGAWVVCAEKRGVNRAELTASSTFPYWEKL